MSEEPERSKTLQLTSIREYIVEFGSKKKIVSPLLVAKEGLASQNGALDQHRHALFRGKAFELS